MNVQAQEYHLPFMGRWFVMQGGDTPNVNHHMDVPAQCHAILQAWLDLALKQDLLALASVVRLGLRDPAIKGLDGEPGLEDSW